MKNNQIFIIVFFVCNLVSGQSKKDVLDKYPFTKANTIMIASFENLQYVNDTLSIIKCLEIPKVNGKVNVGGFEKLLKLNKSEYQKLSKIIFSKSIEENIIGKGNCSETGYAILFFDKVGNVFEYIQFCFNCKTFLSSFAPENLKNDDYEKLDLLKKLFDENGIEISVYRKSD
jgi:hypothetical protein